MEVQLDSLIERLKEEGVETARKEAEGIIESAKNDASKIINEAEQKAKTIIGKAKVEAQRLKESSEEAIKQSARDLILIVKEKIVDLFNQVLFKKIQEISTPEFLKEIIIKIVDKMDTKENIEIVIGEQEKERLFSFLQNELKRELQNTVEININPRLGRGFRIGIKDSNLYYDFTEESLLEILKEFLNPYLAGLLNTSFNGKRE